MKNSIPLLIGALIWSSGLPIAHAAETVRNSAPVEEDSLLKSFKPGKADAPKRELPSNSGAKPSPGDASVQQDPLLRTLEPAPLKKKAPAVTTKPQMQPPLQKQGAPAKQPSASESKPESKTESKPAPSPDATTPAAKPERKPSTKPDFRPQESKVQGDPLLNSVKPK